MVFSEVIAKSDLVKPKLAFFVGTRGKFLTGYLVSETNISSDKYSPVASSTVPRADETRDKSWWRREESEYLQELRRARPLRKQYTQKKTGA